MRFQRLTTMRSSLVALAIGAGLCGNAAASSLALSYSETSAGTAGAGAVTVLSSPSSYVYSNTYNAPTSTTIWTDSSGSYGFYDDFEFSITGATVDSVAATLNLGNFLAIDNFEVRLYNAAGQANLPVLGKPTSTVYDFWSSQFNASGQTGTVSVLPPTALGDGTFVLEVRGIVIGSAGGSYSGTVNVTQAPLPAPLVLLASGLAALAGFRRRGPAPSSL